MRHNRFDMIAGCILLLGWGFILPPPAFAVEHFFSGQLSIWGVESYSDERGHGIIGGRYIPRFELRHDLSENAFIDTDLSLNAFWQSNSRPDATGDHHPHDADLYRATLRFATAQTETRLGLQKINFGPARILRALRWFDRLDPTDPQQLTDGVWAGLWRYNALNNANLWLWGLYGNDDPKGLETLGSVTDHPEFGGRFQYPVPYGEVAVSFHTRTVEGTGLHTGDFRENRFALDGSWDVEIGLWVEAVFQQQHAEINNDWAQNITLGADYTFGLGNGLHVVMEHLSTARGPDVTRWNDHVQATAVSVDYPIGIIDTVSAIGTYIWQEPAYFHHLSWQRTYDDVILNLSGFYYPEAASGASTFQQTGGSTGWGIQLLFIYNH